MDDVDRKFDIDMLYEQGSRGQLEVVQCFFHKSVSQRVKLSVMNWVKELVKKQHMAGQRDDQLIDNLYDWNHPEKRVRRSSGRSGPSGKSGRRKK